MEKKKYIIQRDRYARKIEKMVLELLHTYGLPYLFCLLVLTANGGHKRMNNEANCSSWAVLFLGSKL